MPDLALTMACGPYDRTEALRYGRVRPEGVNLQYVAMQHPSEIFTRMLQDREFDIAEMGCSLHLSSHGKSDYPFVALPVFPSKLFRHGFIFINTGAGIDGPKDLEGKKVGVPAFGRTGLSQAAAVWIRGILQDEYGVSLDRINWYLGPLDVPGATDISSGRPEKEISLQAVPGGKALSDMLESGELDAVLGAQAPSCYGRSGRVRRLFPNHREMEREYYRKTGIFPIMHTLVMKKELHQAHPWLAQSIYDAMVEAKRVCLGEMRFTGASRYTLPWLHDDLDEIDDVFGGDSWPYGIGPNRKSLETLQGYLIDQGFAQSTHPLEEMFIPVVEGTG